MNKQEQIEEMAKIVDEMYNVYTTTADDIAEGLYNVGYRKAQDVGEYKNRFEIADKVLTETRSKLAKAEHDRDRYKAEIERLKSQQREIDRLKAENKELKKVVLSKVYDFVNKIIEETNTRLDIENQAKIDVLNELKEKYGFYSCYSFKNDVKSLSEIIDELIKGV